MVVFISYASRHRDMAEQVKLALAGAGHRVFFDRDKLPAGDDYHLRIHRAVRESEAFVFLISPEAVAAGSYALTELKYAREKWPDPRRRVLPVMVERTAYEQIPNYLKAVTVLEPEGSIAAEIVAELEKWASALPTSTGRRSTATQTQASSQQRGDTLRLIARRVFSGMAAGFGGLMMFMSVVDAGVAGISEGGLLIGGLSLGAAYGLWPRK